MRAKIGQKWKYVGNCGGTFEKGAIYTVESIDDSNYIVILRHPAGPCVASGSLYQGDGFVNTWELMKDVIPQPAPVPFTVVDVGSQTWRTVLATSAENAALNYLNKLSPTANPDVVMVLTPQYNAVSFDVSKSVSWKVEKID